MANDNSPMHLHGITPSDPENAAQVEHYLKANRTKFDSFRSILQRPFLGWGPAT